MKKRLLLFTLSLGAFGMNAQVSTPNGNFESWTAANYEHPQYYSQNSNPEAYFDCLTPFNVTKSTDAYHGSFALQLETNANPLTDTCFGFAANPDNTSSGGGPSSWTGGMPISEKPLGIRGYYKYNGLGSDSAGILVVARQGGANVGMFLIPLGGVHTSYTLFNQTFSPALSVIPDSIILAFVSSNPMASSSSVIPGSIVLFDSISFTGITTQPAQMNGDFETWQTATIETPDMWYIGSNRGQGTSKTTDMAAGNFAMELETYLGDYNGTPRAQPGQAGTGYWDNNCMCIKGGYPFTNQIDTLVFSYKYVPADPSDSASVSLNFKSAGTTIGFGGAFLFPSASYQLMEVPFNIPTLPDSVIIQFQSSAYGDTALSFVGASLKIDEIHFKTQPLMTGINAMNLNNEVRFYPNPFRTTGTITVDASINTTGMIVNIYDVTGKKVKGVSTNEHKIFIDRNDLQNGIYFYELITKENGIKKGKIVVE